MTFEVPPAKASKDQDKFVFKIGPDTYRVKKLQYLSLGQAELVENPQSLSVVLDLFGKTGTGIGDAVRTLNKEQFEALIAAWQKDSDVTLGESGASSS